jgi:uncharacterized phage-associated protein
MSYSSLAVANSFLELSLGTEVPPMTNMKIQKLVYIAHGFTLGMLHEPLIRGHVHAFQHGPVIPTLYEKLKQFGAAAVPGPFSIDFSEQPSPAFQEVIKRDWKRYGQLSAYQLRNITHKDGTPWSITWNETPYGVISNDIIESYYVNLLAKGHAQSA